MIESTPLVPTEKMERDFKIVANIKDKNEKLAWNRRQKKIEGMVEEMQPIEDKIRELQAEQQVHLDKIYNLRKSMVKECIHPRNLLVHRGTFITCKFCNANLSIPKEPK